MSDWPNRLLTVWPWVLVLVLAVLAFRGERRRLHGIRRWFDMEALALLNVEPIRRRLSLAIGLSSIFCLAMAVQRWSEPPTGTHWLVLDVSRSMAVREADGRTRWQQARAVLEPWLDDTRQPVGIVAFQHDAWLVVPPTRDRDAQRQALHQLSPRMDRQGSDPDAALRLVNRLSASSDLAVVVSDGEWASVPATHSGTVIALGSGDPAGGAVPLLPGDAAAPHSRPQAETLAALTGDRVVWTTDGADGLKRLEAAGHAEARSWAFLALALLVLEAGLIVGSRYRLGRLHLPYAWLQRYALWRTRGVVGIVVALLLAGAVPAWEGRWQGVPSAGLPAYNEGVRALARGDHAAAETAWRQAVALDPAWQPAWYNLGTLLAVDPATAAEARQALQEAVRLDPDDAWAVANLAALPAEGQVRTKPGQTMASPSATPEQDSPLSGTADIRQAGQPAFRPSPLPQPAGDAAAADPPRPLTAAEIDRLLGAAEQLPDEDLRHLREQARRPGPLPSLSPEQIQRILALAARVPPATTQPPARTDTEVLAEPARKPQRLSW